jgi:two-component system response regulator ChvI
MLRIAVIEDHQATNDEFKAFLIELWPDCKVEQYLTFAQAITGVKSIDFDLIVSDIDLGDGTDRYGGIKIAKALDSQRTPFLVVSGSPQPELQRDIFRALDAWDYLQKPVTSGDFALQARRAIAFRLAQTRNSEPEVRVGVQDLAIDLADRAMVRWKGRRVILSMTQIRLVQKMIENLNQVVPYADFFGDIESGRNKENLRVHIAGIRDAFKDVDPSFKRISTTTMIGYSWRDE